MADSSDPTAGSRSSKPKDTLRGAPLVGRRIAQAFYGVLVVFVCVASTKSVFSQVFFPEVTASWPPEVTCGEGLRTLEGELLARAATEQAAPGAHSEEQRREGFYRGWDARFVALGLRCEGASGAAHSALGRLRYGIETSLSRNERELSPHIHAIDEALRDTPRAP